MLGRTLYFPDGSHECIYGRDDQEIKDCFSGIVEMRCGHEAAQLFQELVSSPKKRELWRQLRTHFRWLLSDADFYSR